MKKCPYCNRRISYTTMFHIKKQGSYECSRCKKKSKIKHSPFLKLSFLIVVLIAIAFMITWCTVLNMSDNILGFVIVALWFIIYYYVSPNLINIVPLKDYIEQEVTPTKENIFSEEEVNYGYEFNKEAFNEAKRRKSAQSQALNEMIDENGNIDSTRVNERFEDILNNTNSPVVPIIENVSEHHLSSSDGPLQKVNHQKQKTQVFKEPIENIENIENSNYDEDGVKIAERKKPDGTKYTANRKF